MSPRLLPVLAAGVVGLAGCAHESAAELAAARARASTGPTTGGMSDPNAANQAASIHAQEGPTLPPSLSGTGGRAENAPAQEPVTEVPNSDSKAPAAPEAPASPESPK